MVTPNELENFKALIGGGTVKCPHCKKYIHGIGNVDIQRQMKLEVFFEHIDEVKLEDIKELVKPK